MWPNSDGRRLNALCPPCGLLIGRGSRLGTPSFFCPQFLVQVNQTGWEGKLVAG